MRRKTFALIPAFEPTMELVKLVKELVEHNFTIVVVDDGSKHEFQPVFDDVAKYGTVLHQEGNQGKGCALKTGMRYINEQRKEPGLIVTLDADGQHTVADALKVIRAAGEQPEALTIGSRSFSGNVPKRSQFGNSLTRKVYALFTGVKVQDTQTGLRAFGSEMIPYFIGIEGSRYEYEMNVLMECAKDKVPILEQQITTIYLDNNTGSHFRTVRDSIRIYGNIFKFAASSFLGFVVDYLLYSILVIVLGGLQPSFYVPVANVTARIVSASVNFTVNKRFVFKNNDGILKTSIQYFLLAAGIMTCNTVLLSILVSVLGWNKFGAKILTELLFFTMSWIVQKHLIFRPKHGKA